MHLNDSPLRVLYVALGLGTGGAERSVVDLVGPLAQRNIELIFALKEHRTVGAESGLANPPEVAGDGVGLIGWVGSLRQSIRLHRPDVVHTTLFEADLAGRLAAFGTGTPVLSSIVNMSYEPSRLQDPAVSRWRLEAVRRIESWSGRLLTHRFHALTQAVKDAAVRRLHYPEDRIDVVPRAREPERLGLPTSERRARVRKALGVDNSVPVLLTVGRQEYQKAHDDLLRAMPIIRAVLPTARLFVAGRTGNATPRLRALVEELALQDHVEWLGHRDDVGDLLTACDVFVFPSRFEGLGGAVLEAVALGCTVVASDIPPLAEVLEGSDARLFPQGDVGALAQEVIDVVRDPHVREASRVRGPALVSSLYSMDAVADQMARLYRDVAARGTRRINRRDPRLPKRTP